MSMILPFFNRFFKMKQIILLITCLILLSCQHKPKKEKQSFLDTINFDKWECFLDKVEYKFTNLDSISPEFVTKFRREKNEGTSYDFYKLTPEQIKSLLTKEEHYSDVSYGLYVVSKQYEENGLLGIVVFFWMDCEYYGQLLIVDKNCKLIDRFTVFSELNCPNPGDSDEEKTPLNIDHQIFTHFLSFGRN